jgi:hypothetical protein
VDIERSEVGIRGLKAGQSGASEAGVDFALECFFEGAILTILKRYREYSN